METRIDEVKIKQIIVSLSLWEKKIWAYEMLLLAKVVNWCVKYFPAIEYYVRDGIYETNIRINTMLNDLRGRKY